MNAAGLLSQIGENQVAGAFLVLARVSPLFLLAPMFSSRMLPPRVRGIAAVALAVGLTPVALGGAHVPMDVVPFGGLVLKEVVVGLAFALVIALLFAAISTAAALLDLSTGFAFGAAIDPVTGNNGAILGQLYGLLGVAIFIAIGGDAWLIEGLARTYDLVPLVAIPDVTDLVGGMLPAFGSLFAAALAVAAPVMLALLVTDAAFGLVSRVVPQLNVFAAGFPVKVIVGLVIVGASLPFAAGWLGGELRASVETALRAIGGA